jgi:hypothetical protein
MCRGATLATGANRTSDFENIAFTPRDGNALLSSLAATVRLLDPDADAAPLQFAQPSLFDKI